MTPLYPNGRQAGLPTHRADGAQIGPVLRLLLIAILAAVARLPGSGFRLPASGFRLPASGFRLPASGFRLPASGFEVNQATTFAQRRCTGRGSVPCEPGHLLASQIPPSSAGAVDRVLRVGFFVLLLCLVGWLVRPVLRTAGS